MMELSILRDNIENLSISGNITPKFIQWTNTERPIVFTDNYLKKALYAPKPRIALIQTSLHREWIIRNSVAFDAIFTFDKVLLDTLMNAYFLPRCGLGIRPPKQRPMKIDLVSDRLSRAFYSIVEEDEVYNYNFSSRLTDCFFYSVIPIYKGCSDIGNFFDTDGIMSYQTDDELQAILNSISVDTYKERFTSIHRNKRRAKMYICVEDYLYKTYKTFLESCIKVTNYQNLGVK